VPSYCADGCCMWKVVNLSLISYCTIWLLERFGIFFSFLGIQWIMPCGIMDLLACWWHSCSSARIRKLWEMFPPCIFWCIWRERNSRSFEGRERNMLELKGTVLCTHGMVHRFWRSDVLFFLDFLRLLNCLNFY
jgi:hypothetical protein